MNREPIGNFEEFCFLYGNDIANEILQTICELYPETNSNGFVHFNKIHRHNSCNYTLEGHVTFRDKQYNFIVHDGDWAGTVVEAFTETIVPVYEPPPSVRFMFVPRDDHLKETDPQMYNVYLSWSNQSWFTKKLSEYHYDIRFQPGNKIQQYYSQWAEKKGMKIVKLTDQNDA